MSGFSISPANFDGAFCTVDTFRHLLTEKQAINHLVAVADHLAKDAVYVVGMHLLPLQGVTTRKVRWKNSRGRLSVDTTMRVLDVDRTRREESIKMTLRIRTPRNSALYHSEYKLRTYTLRQFFRLLKMARVFEIYECYDQDFNLAHSHYLNEESEDVVFLLRKTA